MAVSCPEPFSAIRARTAIKPCPALDASIISWLSNGSAAQEIAHRVAGRPQHRLIRSQGTRRFKARNTQTRTACALIGYHLPVLCMLFGRDDCAVPPAHRIALPPMRVTDAIKNGAVA